MPDLKPLDLVVVGGIAEDFTVRGSRLPTPGGSTQAKACMIGGGGKGGNAAAAAALFGARVSLIGCVGRDERGERLLRDLADARVDIEHVVRDPERATSITLICVDRSGRKQTAAWPGANSRLTPAHVRAAAPTIEWARALLAQLEVPLACVREAIGIAARASTMIVLDAAPARALPDELLQRVDVLRANAPEATLLSGVEVKDRASAREAAQRLLTRGVRMAAVEAGDEGDLVMSLQDEYWLPRFRIRTVDTTGAGDAFAAALTFQLVRGAALEDAARFASGAAALAASGLGAQTSLPDVAAVETLLRTHVTTSGA